MSAPAFVCKLRQRPTVSIKTRRETAMKTVKNSAALMTEGPIWKKIIAFARPLFLGNLFQQLYTTADSLIVGNFLGSSALAAVSSSGPPIFLLVGFFNGIAVGAGVVTARYYGARQSESVSQAVHTTVAFGIVAGVLLTVLGLIYTPVILRLMGTPGDVLPESVVYFRIYFSGSLAFVLYNIFVGILQSVGDSRHPLIYLIISSAVNVALDLLLIAVLGFGVGAAALATVISQFLSAFLCLIRLTRTRAEYQIIPRRIRFDGPMLRQIAANGLPAGFQNSIIALANVVVQSNINKFGKMAVAGCGTYSTIEGFGFLPITCFALAMTTFISQNLGARQYGRAKQGARFGILCSIGTAQAHTITLFYFLLAFSHCVAGILRGAGKSTVPMVVMMVFWCIVRVTYITIGIHFLPDIRIVFWAYPLTWSLSSLVFLVYFLQGKWVYGFEAADTSA